MEAEEILQELKFERAMAEKRDKAFLKSLEELFKSFSASSKENKISIDQLQVAFGETLSAIQELSKKETNITVENKGFSEKIDELNIIMGRMVEEFTKEEVKEEIQPVWVFDVKRGANGLIQQVIAKKQ